MAKERALDIFVLLEQIDKKNYNIWENLTEEQRKEFSPLVVMRWMAGCTDPFQLILLNEIANILVFPLGDKKEQLLLLLTACSNGKTKRYKWLNYKVSSSKKKKHAINLIAQHYSLSLREAEDSFRLFSSDDIMQLAELQGLQKDELAELKKELKT